MGIKAGIDLGTTFSAVAVIDENTGLPKIVNNSENEKTTPSVIQFADGVIKCGIEAKEAFSNGEAGCAAFFKRNMGLHQPYITADGKNFTAEELSGILLKHIKEDAENVLGTKIDEAVITVPAYFYSKEREATMEAARLAGLKVRKIINEPTAAVIAYGLEHWRTNANILVYDLGGGTFDVTLVRMDDNEIIRTLSTTGNRFLGGSDWDKRMEEIIIGKILEETGFNASESERFKEIIKGCAENCKKQLSNRDTARYKVSVPDFGWVTVKITRDEFDGATIDLLDQTGVLCEAVLSDAGITWNDVTDVLLVGGSTRMIQVKEYLRKLSGRQPISHVNPDEAVALGAAVQTILADPDYAALKVMDKEEKYADSKKNRLIKSVEPERKLSASHIKKILLNEVTTHPMGIIAVNKEGTHYINELIIPANHPIPTRSVRSFKFFTSPGENNELEIYVLQGEGKPLECVIPYKYVVTGIKYENKGETIIRIQYSYDLNGIIHVQARQGNSKVDLPIRKESVPEDMSMYGRPVDKSQFLKREPLSVIMAIDTSGSMWGDPIVEAKRAMHSFIGQFAESMKNGETKIGIAAFDYGNDMVQELTDNIDKCQAAIDGIDNRGGAGEHPIDGIREGFSNVMGRKCAIILTDGIWFDNGRAIAAAKTCHEIGIEIATIGFGDANGSFLSAISSSTANAFLVNQGEIVSTFGKIAQSLEKTQSNNRLYTEKYTDTEVWDIV